MLMCVLPYETDHILERAALQHWPGVKKDFEDCSSRIRLSIQRLVEKANAHALASISSRPAMLLQALSQTSDGASTPNTDANTPFLQIHNIPHERNSHFMARDTELQTIASSFTQDPSRNMIRSFALWGTGGVGKTQVALEYAYKELESGTQVVLWVDCENGLSMGTSFAEIACKLMLPGALENDITTQNRLLVLKWLQKARKWMMFSPYLQYFS